MTALTDAIDSLRVILNEPGHSTKIRIRLLWSAAKMASDLDSHRIVRNAFIKLAIDVNLINDDGYWTGSDVRKSVQRYGGEDLDRVIKWALRGWNPFEKGPLK
jgi:hypothetical protein